MDYNKESFNILSDDKSYAKIEDDPFPEREGRFLEFIKKAFEDVIITKDEFRFINVPFPSKSYFYTCRRCTKNQMI